MKRIFTLICLGCLLSVSLLAQNRPYYWVGDVKHYLAIDSSEYLIEQVVSDDAMRTRLKNDPDLKGIRFENGSKVQYIVSATSRKSVSARIGTRARQIVHPVMRESRTGAKTFITDEITIKFKVDPNIEYFAGKYGIELIKKTSFGAYLFRINDRSKTLQVANLIRETEPVLWSSPNFVLEITQFNDPLYPSQYYLNNTGQNGGTANIDINAPEAWQLTLGCGTIRVAVIDDGVEDHEDFSGRVVSGFTAGDNNTLGAPGAGCAKGHGVACAGIIAASANNGIGIRGIAPNSIIVPINIFPHYPLTASSSGIAENSEIAEAVHFAWYPTLGNADVISNSWGTAPSSDITYEFDEARVYGRGGLGAIVIVASGNHGGVGVAYPANIDRVITVGAIKKTGALWGYSNQGPEMDLVAPSGALGSVDPIAFCKIMGGDVATSDRMGSNGFNNSGNYLSGFGGTSAAAPQVAGVAALMLSVNPNLTALEVRTILQQSATDMGSTGFDISYGYGRLNARAAVQAVMPTLSGPTLICSGTGYFNLANVPMGATVSWQAQYPSFFSTSSGSYVSGGTSATIPLTVVGTPNGPASLVVTINSCGTPVTVTYNFHVGNPTPGISAVYNSSHNWVTFDPSSPVQGTTYTWVINGVAYPYANAIFNLPSCGGSPYITYFNFNAELTATNACGSTTVCRSYQYTCVPTRSFTSLGVCGGGPLPCNPSITTYQVSPNPAKGSINIIAPMLKPPPCESLTAANTATPRQVDQPDDSGSDTDTEQQIIIQSVKIYDMQGRERYSQTFNNEKNLQIDISRLNMGIYILRISDGKRIEQQRIIVQ